MNNKQDHVFELVKSLSQGEKRNLMQLSKLQKGSKDYLRLFRLLDEMEEYDEKAIKRKIRIRSFAYTKHYLYNFILRSLFVFEQGEQIDLLQGIRHVKYLMDRSAYGAARKLATQLMKKAGEAELFEEWERLLELELELLIKSQDIKRLQDNLERINAEMKSVKEILENLKEYKQLYNELFLISKTKFLARGEIDLEPIRKLQAHPLMETEKRALSTRAQVAFWQNKISLELYLGEFEAATQAMKRSIQLYDKFEFIRNEKQEDYINLLTGLGSMLSAQRKEEEFKENFAKIRSIQPQTQKLKMDYFDKTTLMLLAYATDSGDESIIRENIEEIQKNYLNFEEQLPLSQRMQFCFFIAKSYLLLPKPREALKFTRRIIEIPKTEIRKDIQVFARLLTLLILVEEDEPELFEHFQKSTLRYLARQKRLYAFEENMLKFLRTMANLTQSTDKLNAYKGFKKELLELFENDFEAKVIDYFDILSWLDSRIESRPFAEVLRRKYKKEASASF